MLQLILLLALAAGFAEDVRALAFRDSGVGKDHCDNLLREWDIATGPSGLPSVAWAKRNAPAFYNVGCRNLSAAAQQIVLRYPDEAAAAEGARVFESHPDTVNLTGLRQNRSARPESTGEPPPTPPRPPPQRPQQRAAPPPDPDPVAYPQPEIPANLAFCGGDGVGWIEVLTTGDRASFAGSRPSASTRPVGDLPQIGDRLEFSSSRPATLYTGLTPCLIPEDIGCAPSSQAGTFRVAGRVRYATGVSRERWQLCVTKED